MHLSPKKSLGQHFLNDENIAQQIVNSLLLAQSIPKMPILEIGPGMGILTKYFLNSKSNLFVIEKDKAAVAYLEKNMPEIREKIIHADFLDYDINNVFPYDFAVIGNFPYNISSQILFKVLELRNRIPLVVCMLQKEVAQRIASKADNKTYGIMSVLLQAYYDIEYLFTVDENVFTPPPKVKSAVIRITRNNTQKLNCDENLFFKIVKTAFNQRRKMLRNSLKPFGEPINKIPADMMTKRPENFSVDDFVKITNLISQT